MSQLTKYPTGSVRELWFVAYPLMISSFSLLAMIFCDRLFLAHYSPETMSAAVTAGTASWAIMGSLTILASMSEVFVAQYNGAKQQWRIGRPVWQMLWFSLVSVFFLIPIGIWGGQLLFYHSAHAELEKTYFFWICMFGISWPLQGGLSAFWVGRGKTRLITCLALGANVVNIILDWVLIFGIEGVIPAYGIAGAAVATCMGNFFQVAVLLTLFLLPHNRQQFGAGDWGFRWPEMRKVLRIGAPQSTLFFIECIGWAIFYMMISHVGPEHIFVAGICQSVLILFFFAAEGIGRGAAAISGNLIGAGRGNESFKVFGAGLRIHVIFFAFASLFFVVYPEPFINLFTSKAFSVIGEGTTAGDMTLLNQTAVMSALKISLQLSLFYLLFEGLRWLISGILSAAGDTPFLLASGTAAVPIFLLIPTYIFVERMHYGTSVAFVICVVYAFAVGTIFFYRFIGRKWQKIDLISDGAEESSQLPG